jgi:hypothetical protein
MIPELLRGIHGKNRLPVKNRELIIIRLALLWLE